MVDTEVVSWDADFLEEFHRVNESLEKSSGPMANGSGHRREPLGTWNPPSCGWFKMNTDAVVDSSNGRVGLAEVVAILRGLSFALEVGLFPCSIEYDVLVVIKVLQSDSDPFSEVGLVLHDIRLLLPRDSSSLVSFVLRNANMAAHGLAKFALSIDIDRIWLEDCPPVVAPIFLGDCPLQL
ncbi:hypothetical protein Dsin_026981 [Dipteronia sinensis]|uniref:RNase H type-1 domain-containing protein n=1 Tax=Dipteronia sinensis TaxID=43782 RepID=A0AAD9ZYW7_9ROSI|nr:hypothetical protein Dsin_026981 [Dipteronia sinensis]